jgi:hypothetical protein
LVDAKPGSKAIVAGELAFAVEAKDEAALQAELDALED